MNDKIKHNPIAIYLATIYPDERMKAYTEIASIAKKIYQKEIGNYVEWAAHDEYCDAEYKGFKILDRVPRAIIIIEFYGMTVDDDYPKLHQMKFYEEEFLKYM